MTIRVVVEGDTDLPFVRKLVARVGLVVEREFDMGGKHALDEQFRGFNAAARHSPWLVVRDLDHDAPCAGAFLARQAIEPAPWMAYRLAVREVEAWALADRSAFAAFFGVRVSQIPPDPDGVDDPTRLVVDLCQHARSSRIREAVVPRPGTRTPVGPLYEATLIEFGQKHWDVERACLGSASLARTYGRLITLAADWNQYVGAGS